MCCMDYSLGGHFGHVTNNTACNGGGYVDSRPSLFSSLYPWFSSGIFSKMVAFQWVLSCSDLVMLSYNTHNTCSVKSCCLNNWIWNMTWGSKLSIGILHWVFGCIWFQEHAYICHRTLPSVHNDCTWQFTEGECLHFHMQQLVVYIFFTEVCFIQNEPTLHVAMKWCIPCNVHYSSHYEVPT